jgi:hypothetical protein
MILSMVEMVQIINLIAILMNKELKIYFDKFANLKAWKWVYYCGISLAGVIFLSNLYNISVAFLSDFRLLDNGYRHIYKGFLSFYAAKTGIVGLFNATIILVLPSFLSLFIAKKYFYKIAFVVFTTFIFLFVLSFLIIFLKKLGMIIFN